jgi:hypothetical protein
VKFITSTSSRIRNAAVLTLQKWSPAGEDLHSLQAYVLDVAGAPWVEGNGYADPPSDLVTKRHLEDCEGEAASPGYLTRSAL